MEILKLFDLSFAEVLCSNQPGFPDLSAMDKMQIQAEFFFPSSLTLFFIYHLLCVATIPSAAVSSDFPIFVQILALDTNALVVGISKGQNV